MRTSARVIAILGLICLAGCRPESGPRPGSTDFRVVGIEFEGVESVDRVALLDALATQRNAFNPFAPVSYYNRFELASDIERIEAYYQAQGFFGVQVTDYDVSLEEGRRRNRAVVTFVVEEGPETTLATDAVYDESGLVGIEEVYSILGNSALRAGSRFDQYEVGAERIRLRTELQERSYARAQVDARVYVDRDTGTAQVYFFFTPGVACVFGEIEIEGERQLSEELIRDNVPIRPGRPFRQSLLRRAQVELYDLDAFTSVEVEAQLSVQGEAELQAFQEVDDALAARGFYPVMHLRDPVQHTHAATAGLLDNLDEIEASDPAIPITIRVTESANATYKFGGGVGIESSRTEAYALARGTWRNVFAPLNRAELVGRLGYAWLPTVFNRETLAAGIIGEIETGLSRPKVVLGFDAAMRFGFEHGVETDHEFSRPSVTFALENRLNEHTRLSFGYGFSLNITRDFADQPIIDGARGSCDRLPRAFRLGYLDVNVNSERRDSNLAEHANDVAWAIGVQAGEGALGDYPYVRVEPELRYYRRLGRRLSIATRFAGGAIIDPGEPVPRSQCLFLGGGSSVRGFADRRLGPHQEPNIPRGGVASYLFNFEPRFRLSDLLGLVAFFDAGQVNKSLAFSPTWGGDAGVQASAGGGLRVFTPIGPVRADFGVRVTPVPGDWGKVRPFSFVLSLGEAF
jgi:translocation and assembly module TamA